MSTLTASDVNEILRQSGLTSKTQRDNNTNFENAINDKNNIILIAESNGFLVGCAEISLLSNCPETKDNSPELTILYVFEHFKEKGVGYSLISKTENLVKEKGFSELWLTVYHLNENAISFYKRQNYKIIGSTFFEMGGNKYENKIMYKRIK